MKEDHSRIDDENSAAAESEKGGRFHLLQANRDLEANWTVDLAKNLEDYLLKICSGEIDADGEEMNHLSVNFAEAAMLLQGSIQVYSRKVEYLYTLVLHAMEFLSREKHDLVENPSLQADGTEVQRVTVKEDGKFLGLDDIQVEANTCLDDEENESNFFNHHIKPPANLLVVEGENISESNKLDSYLLSTCNFFGDFLLLDPCDAEAVYNFQRNKNKAYDQTASRKSSALKKINAQNPFHSPYVEKSGEKGQRASAKKQNANFGNNMEDPPSCLGGPEYEFPDMNNDDNDEEEDDDNDDPWKPLNPHEAGNLRIRPYKRCSIFKRKIPSFNKRMPVSLEFPEAKVEGPIDPELSEIFAKQICARAHSRSSQSFPLFEKLRQTLVGGKDESHDDLMHDHDNETDDVDADSDVMDDIDLTQNSMNGDAEMPLVNEKLNNVDPQFNYDEELDTEKRLEDLCRSHLDYLLASIVEAEKQTEIASRVSTWKQKIERTLEKEDSISPFDIHLYGEKIVNKLLEDAGDEDRSMCFTDVVSGQHKHDIARTFSALLQLVNDGTVELHKGSASDSTCFTSVNPFHVRLNSEKRIEGEKVLSLKKRVSSPPSKKHLKDFDLKKSTSDSGKKGDDVRWLTPDGKKRRKSRIR